MWVFVNIPGTKKGAFISISPKDEKGNPSCIFGNMSVRARREKDLQALFPHNKVHDNKGKGDYQFRCFVSRAELKILLNGLVDQLTETNFKNSIKDDEMLHDACMEIWTTMEKLQPKSAYSGWPEKNLILPLGGYR